jgi:MoaA/NifB/PqqE/SkfB family radical SAM enzyme
VLKKFRSTEYNFTFDTVSGFFARWGKNKEDDPSYSPYGPEILDIEVSTICHGINGKPCVHCYKSNTGVGKNMTLETFKTILDKMPKVLTQVAFGIGDIDSNPDLFKMFEYCREKTIIPNVTINGWNLTDEYADKLVSLCGAVAVSRYNPPDVCYNAVRKLLDKGLKQVNIHMMVSEETYADCFTVMEDYLHDERLKGMNAIVFLLMKPKGKRNNFKMLKSLEKYQKLINYALDKEVAIGFDSCSAPLFLHSVVDHPNFKQFDTVCEACESSLFSSYINVEGVYFPCSFTEGENFKGIDVVNCENFLKNVWFEKGTKHFRNLLTTQESKISKTLRKCPVFDLYEEGI